MNECPREKLDREIAKVKAKNPDKVRPCPSCGTDLLFTYGRADCHRCPVKLVGVQEDFGDESCIYFELV